MTYFPAAQSTLRGAVLKNDTITDVDVDRVVPQRTDQSLVNETTVENRGVHSYEQCHCSIIYR